MKTWADFGIELKGGSGAERYTTCPKCSAERKRANQRKPCLSVNVDKEVWYCHHCGWAGTLQQGEDRRYQGNNLHWKKPEWVRPTYQPDATLSEGTLAFFTKRGISKEVVERNRITTGSVYMPQVGDWVNAIRFPFYRGGEVINVKYRDKKKNFRMEAQAERIFYGLEDVNPTMTIIVEGEMDKLAVEQAGMTYCISVPDGAPAPTTKDYSSKFEFLENCKAQLEGVECFALAVDSDEAGKKLEEELLHRLGRDKCVLVKWPEGCKDANDVLLTHGAQAVMDCIYNAEPPPVPGIVKVYDIMERLEHLYDNGLAPGVTVGWRGLQDLYRVSLGEWTLVTGIPGHGKSEFLDAMLVNLANLYDWAFAIYSPENHPLEQHIAKILEKRVGKPFRGADVFRMDRDELRTGAAWMNCHFQFLKPDEGNLSLDGILELAKSAIYRDGIKGLIIDPWNELEHERPPNLTETEYISKCLTRLRQFARGNQIHIWVVAHPTKLQKDKNNIYPVPTAYDVSGSAHWNNKADNVISIWRDRGKEGSPVQVYIQKIRFKKNGRIGMAQFMYNTTTGTFTDTL